MQKNVLTKFNTPQDFLKTQKNNREELLRFDIKHLTNRKRIANIVLNAEKDNAFS